MISAPPEITGLAEWRPLASGGFSTVWQARQESLNRWVAVKVDDRKLTSESERRRFLREAGAAGRMSGHPGIVTVHDAGILPDNRPYLVMELCPGGSLSRWLKPEERKTQDRVRDVGVRIADALAAAHARGVLHRDVKPANILIDGTGSAYVTDFGLAKSRDASALTRPGFAVGSVHYMAPEQARAEEVGTPADVYGLGCVVYECLSGRPPFAGRKGVDVLAAHLHEQPGDPFAERDDGSAELRWAVLRALEKDPSARPPTTSAYARMVQVAAGVPPLSPGR